MRAPILRACHRGARRRDWALSGARRRRRHAASTAARCSAGDRRQPRSPRHRALVRDRGLGDPRGDRRRAARVQEGGGGAGAQIVPDLADDDADRQRRRQDLRLHACAPACASRRPSPARCSRSDIKFSIERLFRIDSGGVGFYTGIVGANAVREDASKGGISGIVANDKAHTITFHLTKPDGTFLDYVAIPFAFAVPKGTPDRDISTVAKWRVATGPVRDHDYVPKQEIVLKRNPNFHQWTPNSPNGHLDEIDIKIGVDPEQAVNEDDGRPARLVLRRGAERPAHRAQGAVPEAGVHVDPATTSRTSR